MKNLKIIEVVGGKVIGVKRMTNTEFERLKITGKNFHGVHHSNVESISIPDSENRFLNFCCGIVQSKSVTIGGEGTVDMFSYCYGDKVLILFSDVQDLTEQEIIDHANVNLNFEEKTCYSNIIRHMYGLPPHKK